jgi:hypothetical protein
VHALLKDLAGIDELTAVTDRALQRVDDAGLGRPTGALTDEPDQRRAIAIIGLETTRAQLTARRRRL